MAEVPGFGQGFNSTVFRNNIKNVMKMAAPNAVVERVTFQWPVQKTYTGKVDPTGRPYDLASSTSEVVSKDDEQVDCAFELINRTPTGTPIGEFNNPQGTITVLDVDYAKIQGSTRCLVGGNRYNVNYVEPIGLFDVTVYILHVTAEDEA